MEAWGWYPWGVHVQIHPAWGTAQNKNTVAQRLIRLSVNKNPFTKPGVSTKYGETAEALSGDEGVGEYLHLYSLFPMTVRTGAGSGCYSWPATSLSSSSLAHTSSCCLTQLSQVQSTLRHYSLCLAHLQGTSCGKYPASCSLQLQPASLSW